MVSLTNLLLLALDLLRRLPNPVRLTILWIGLGLARLGLIDEHRARRTTELAWPRIVTGLARMSKNAVDVAMVGVAVGSAAIAGVGFAGPFYGLAFSVGSGIAAGTIALVSQRYGAEAYEELGLAIRASTALVIIISLPIVAVFWTYSTELISLLTDNEAAIREGSAYLQIVSLAVPLAGLNLVGSRAMVGCDDSWIEMLVRAGGAVANIVLNAILIFGFGLGVEGAAMGTVLSNLFVTAAFAIGLARGRLPGVPFPVQVDPRGTYLDLETFRQIIEIGLPVIGRNTTWTAAEFPMLAIVNIFGQDVVAAYVIARRIWGLMNTPGWGFGLASSSLVGQNLGTGDEATAEQYGREIIRHSVAVYAVSAIIVAVFAEPIVHAFVDDPTELSIPVAVALVYTACLAVLLQGVSGAASGPLDASGDTRWPFYSQVIGMFGVAIPLTYLGAAGLSIPAFGPFPGFSLAPLGIGMLYLSFIAETAVPAAINYWRFTTGKWKAISREYRPDSAPSDD